MSHQLRPAHPSERSALEELQRRASLKWDPSRPEQLQHPDALSLSADLIAAGLVIVCEHWGAPAGFAVVVPREDGEAELGGPYVEPDLWRTGIGRALIEEAAQFAAALECAALVAAATPLSEPFYTRCGFRSGGSRDTAHGPVAVMQRDLVTEPAQG